MYALYQRSVPPAAWFPRKESEQVALWPRRLPTPVQEQALLFGFLRANVIVRAYALEVTDAL